MVKKKLVELMDCPLCRTDKIRQDIKKSEGEKIEDGDLICETCNTSYPIRYGILDMIPHHVLGGEKWQTWKDHLDGYQMRQEQRIKQSTSPVYRSGKKKKAQSSFSDFINANQGWVLDVGCGSGQFGSFFDEKCEYHGIDPITAAGAEDFNYIRALGEYIPYKDSTFSHVVVLSSLDHFLHTDVFFAEVIRVLKLGGKFHVMQNIHEISNPKSAVKMMAHVAKKLVEERTAKNKRKEAPRHMAEYSQYSLRDELETVFEIVAEYDYLEQWHAPVKKFLTMQPKENY